ncbi:hypothetical protein [Paenibacillus sp. FSL E2-0177]|uniref:hypothetical protein n=1 Tax=Paenibacillus sp. FSL E2-0177 TaxID=2921360 RepID=UPI0030EB6DE5
MAKVFVHTHEKGDSEWENEYYPFSRVPVEGEFLTLASDGEWYKVEMVVHTPFDREIHAEIYAVKVDHMKIQKRKLNTEPTFSFE